MQHEVHLQAGWRHRSQQQGASKPWTAEMLRRPRYHVPTFRGTIFVVRTIIIPYGCQVFLKGYFEKPFAIAMLPQVPRGHAKQASASMQSTSGQWGNRSWIRTRLTETPNLEPCSFQPRNSRSRTALRFFLASPPLSQYLHVKGKLLTGLNLFAFACFFFLPEPKRLCLLVGHSKPGGSKPEHLSRQLTLNQKLDSARTTRSCHGSRGKCP